MKQMKNELLDLCARTLRKWCADERQYQDGTWRTMAEANDISLEAKANADALIARLPDFLEQLISLVGDNLEPTRNRQVAVLGLNYLLMPFDVIPETKTSGIYGFLDDALLLRACCARLTDDCPPSLRQLLSDTEKPCQDLLTALPERIKVALDLSLNRAGTAISRMQATEHQTACGE